MVFENNLHHLKNLKLVFRHTYIILLYFCHKKSKNAHHLLSLKNSKEYVRVFASSRKDVMDYIVPFKPTGMQGKTRQKLYHAYFSALVLLNVISKYISPSKRTAPSRTHAAGGFELFTFAVIWFAAPCKD